MAGRRISIFWPKAQNMRFGVLPKEDGDKDKDNYKYSLGDKRQHPFYENSLVEVFETDSEESWKAGMLLVCQNNCWIRAER